MIRGKNRGKKHISLLAAGAAALLVAAVPRVANAELLYATDGTSITTFDSTALNATTTVAVTGLQGGETLVGIDLRPATGQLVGIGSTSRVYTIDPAGGQATQVGAAGAFTLNGTAFGTDFNPVPDRIRQVSNTEQNLRLNPNNGALGGTDTTLSPPGNVVAAAYTNNFAGATQTTLYVIDSAAGTLSTQGGVNGTPSPNGGQLFTVGSLGLGTNLNENIGFDVSGSTGTAFATITVGGTSGLYTVDLATGAATLVGSIGAGATPFLGVTAGTPVYVINGYVRAYDLAPVEGVSITRNDANTGQNVVTVTTNADGFYQFTAVPNGYYALGAELPGFTFSPGKQGLRVNGAGRSANFIATNTAATFSVSGRLSNSVGEPLVGVTVNLNADTSPAGVRNPVVTNSAGYYKFLSVPNGEYAVMPSLAGTTFTPFSRNATVAGGDVSNLNFIGAMGAVVSGRLQTSNGIGIAGASVQLDNGPTVITNGAGYYVFRDVANGVHTITPSANGFVFTPSSREFEISLENRSGLNFIGTQP